MRQVRLDTLPNGLRVVSDPMPGVESVLTVTNRDLLFWSQSHRDAAFRALDVPVLYMTGRHSPMSAHGVARLLTRALPRVLPLTCTT